MGGGGGGGGAPTHKSGGVWGGRQVTPIASFRIASLAGIPYCFLQNLTKLITPTTYSKCLEEMCEQNT